MATHTEDLEARALAAGLYTDDRDVYGHWWPAVLLRRLDNHEWALRVTAAATGRPPAEMACTVGGEGC